MSEIGGSNLANQIAQSPKRADAVMSKIQSQLESIKGLFAAVQALIAEIQAHKASKPEKPNTTGMDSDKAAAVMARFDEAMTKWSDQLNKLNDRMQSLQEKLHSAENKLNKLQNIDLPAAEARDRDDMRKQLEQMQRSLKEAAESLDTGGEDRVDDKEQDAMVRRAEVRAMVVKRQTENGIRDFVTLVVGQPNTLPPKDTKEVTGSSLPRPGGTGIPTEG